jgi:hypothetical protein
MKDLNYKFWFVSLLIGTFVLNFIQAHFTGVMSDETYYALYGAHLSWGYFDHPPAVAFLIKISSLFFPGALGIRFMTTVLYSFTLFFIWKVINEKKADTEKVLLFFLVAYSVVMFSVYGFITTPDVPLLFFTALFLFAYRQFLKDPSLKVILLLGVVMAGLVYSKYQASLVIGFVVISNLRLLRNGRFWAAALLGLLLLFPHIYWQYIHEFPTLKYHLVDRASEFKWWYILEYGINILLVFNPFVFFAILYIFIKYRPRDLFERALYFLIIGFILFFWIMGIRGHIQPQWTVAVSIPMIIILYSRMQENKKLKDYAVKFMLPMLFILLIVRVLIATNSFVASKIGFEKTHPQSQLISKVAGELPVVFVGSFQGPSKYHYFTQKNAFTLSSIEGRYTQFDIWQFEKQCHNKPVFVSAEIPGRSKKISDGGITIDGFITSSLQTVNRMHVDYEIPVSKIRQGDTIVMKFSVHNPYPFTIDFHHIQFPVTVSAIFISNGKYYFQPVRFNSPIDLIDAGNTIKREISFTVPKLKSGTYQFGFSLRTCLCDPLNSKLVKVELN